MTQMEAPRSEVERFRRNLVAERDGIALYEALAESERDAARAEIWRELAAAETRHAARWESKLREAGAELPHGGPGARVRLLGWLARRFGARHVAPIVIQLERGDASMYAGQPDAADFAREEEQHGRTLAAMGRAAAGPAIAEREHWHRGGASGALRAGVFGVNDGLVSNASLVMGMAGAEPGNHVVLLAGVAGLLAGAFSMAAGEYVSMQAQRELLERQIALERDELLENPDEERQELELIYRAKGVPPAQAARLAETLMADPEHALDTLVREELGLDPTELGSPWIAAASSFIAFALGAIVPVLPYLLGAGGSAFLASVILSAVALFGVGATLSLFTGRNALYSGARMLAIGSLAAGVTFLVGRLIGVAVAG